MTIVLTAIALTFLFALLFSGLLYSSGRLERAWAMPTSTSLVAAAIAVEGLVLQVGNGASPQVFNSICNLQDWNEPNVSETVDVTNVGDNYRRRIATLLDLGKMKAKIFWVMTEPTHQDAVNAGISGLRFLWKNQILTQFQVVYPNQNQSIDRFLAYVTSFSISGKVGGVFEAEIEFTANDGAPTLA
jgi:hypothetical protein